MKYLLVLIVFALIASQLWRQFRRNFHGVPGVGSMHRKPQIMVRCNQCDVHVPQHEAFYRIGLPYCCAAHARNAAPGETSGASIDEQKPV